MPELTIASPGRRIAAHALDIAICMSGGGLVLAAAGKAFHSERDELPPRWWHALEIAGHVTAVPTRNWRSPGWQLLGLRRVDAHTGGPVGVRSALIRDAVSAAERALSRPLLRRAWRRSSERTAELQPRIDELKRAHADDSVALQRALMELYKDEKLNPLAPCLWGLAGTSVLRLLALWSPRRQTLPDRLAGLVVVVDR
jgi:uncharacterized RDD family membrane protein YckC